MRIEHVAYQVKEPLKVAEWYVEHLGFTIKRQIKESPYMTFVADENGMMIEMYNNPAADVLDYPTMDPLQLHLAFVSDDVEADKARLLAAGCTVAADITTTPAGDQLLMLRDPWGFAIQLCKRAEPMV